MAKEKIMGKNSQNISNAKVGILGEECTVIVIQLIRIHFALLGKTEYQ